MCFRAISRIVLVVASTPVPTSQLCLPTAEVSGLSGDINFRGTIIRQPSEDRWLRSSSFAKLVADHSLFRRAKELL
jgi:hypothetical protein